MTFSEVFILDIKIKGRYVIRALRRCKSLINMTDKSSCYFYKSRNILLKLVEPIFDIYILYNLKMK